MSGPSDPPNPDVHAFRKDLADAALAGRVIASHYAEPLARKIATDTPLLRAPDPDADAIRDLQVGESFDLLDCTLGWAWGYAGEDRRVGYVRSDALNA